MIRIHQTTVRTENLDINIIHMPFFNLKLRPRVSGFSLFSEFLQQLIQMYQFWFTSLPTSLLYSHTFFYFSIIWRKIKSFTCRLKSSRIFHVFKLNLKKHHFKKLVKGFQPVLPEENPSVVHPLQLAPKESSNFRSKLILGSPIHPLEVCFLCAVTQRTCSGAGFLGWYWVVDNKSSTGTSALITAQF